MQIKYLPEFYDAFRKLSSSDKESVKVVIDVFQDNPHDPSLWNHPLEKPMLGKRSISAWEDLRIIFREKAWYIEVLMLESEVMRIFTYDNHFSMRIWFIWLGLMGIPMARNILKKSWEIRIWNRTPERAQELISLGAKLCDSKTELAAEVDILITMVTAGEDVDAILFGPDGCADALKPGSIVIDMSTIWVEWAENIAKKLDRIGVSFLDAPVTGSTPKAITGELTIFVGWDPSIYEKSQSVLATMGTNLQYMWPTGTGQAMKLVNNALVAYSMIGLAEVMKLGGAMGLDSMKFAEVIGTLPVSSPYIAMKVDNFVRDDFPVMFSLANMSKDISLAYGEMTKYGLSLDMLSLANDQYKKWKEQWLWWLDVSAIGKIV